VASVVFGLAGLAEASLALGQAVSWLCFVVLAGLCFVTFMSRSTRLAWITLGIALVSSLLLMPTPWDVFRPVSSNDPDVVHWTDVYRTLCIGWLVVITCAVGLVPLVHRLARIDKVWLDQREN
jgi:hypothetical protein